MRVVSGKYRSRRLIEFKGTNVRPTSDMTKESLFNILGNMVNKTFLDLFCGTGSMGIECISRGGESVFVDVSSDSINITKKNLTLLKEEAEVYNLDYQTFLNTTNKKFDVIFIDPPYKSDFGLTALKLIYENKILLENGVVVFESDDFKGDVLGFKITDKRKYGKAYLTFYKYE